MPDRARLGLIARRVAICVVLAVALAPVVWLFSIAYKPQSDIFSSPPTFLFTPTWDNFRSVFRYFNLSALLEFEPHYRRRLDGALASHRRAGGLCAGPRGKPARGLARLLLSRHPHGAGDRDADPVLSSDARHRTIGHLVGGDHPQHRAQQRLRRLDDVLLLSRRAGVDRGSGADRRLRAISAPSSASPCRPWFRA